LPHEAIAPPTLLRCLQKLSALTTRYDDTPSSHIGLTPLQIIYTPELRRLVSNAADLFLEILRINEQEVLREYGLKTMEDRMKVVCPPCHYKVSNTFRLCFSLLILLGPERTQTEILLLCLDGWE
jgi:hypothetical protein